MLKLQCRWRNPSNQSRPALFRFLSKLCSILFFSVYVVLFRHWQQMVEQHHGVSDNFPALIIRQALPHAAESHHCLPRQCVPETLAPAFIQPLHDKAFQGSFSLLWNDSQSLCWGNFSCGDVQEYCWYLNKVALSRVTKFVWRTVPYIWCHNMHWINQFTSISYCHVRQQHAVRSPSRNRIWCILALKYAFWWQQF